MCSLHGAVRARYGPLTAALCPATLPPDRRPGSPGSCGGLWVRCGDGSWRGRRSRLATEVPLTEVEAGPEDRGLPSQVLGVDYPPAR